MKALCVFSGGLDSMLASQLVKAQDIEVLGLYFETPFFSSEKARKSAQTINLPLKVIDLTGPHLKVVKNPRHGYGGNMNPCIDCHVLMLRTAGERLGKEKADFLVTGEVLGQRPMSQNKKALATVAAESGFEGLILRPLSAKQLPPTIPEEKGWIKRDELLDFSGRSRKPQMQLAEKFQIKDYPSPAGGCLLTDPIFSRRLKDLLSSRPHPEVREIQLLKVGRHFRIGPRTKLVVGRNKAENETILSLAKDADGIVNVGSVPGPTVLVLGDLSPELEALATSITVTYSDAEKNQPTQVTLSRGGTEKVFVVKGGDKEVFKTLMV
ncbi:MAG: tRNA 4-thiouridine(8) synthase ThiI [Desulfobacterales bacterium]|nr:tRNA 4-thiouridine(8) synthase ThiI [Desulfobacterales bacterium]